VSALLPLELVRENGGKERGRPGVTRVSGYWRYCAAGHEQFLRESLTNLVGWWVFGKSCTKVGVKICEKFFYLGVDKVKKRRSSTKVAPLIIPYPTTFVKYKIKKNMHKVIF